MNLYLTVERAKLIIIQLNRNEITFEAFDKMIKRISKNERKNYEQALKENYIEALNKLWDN